MLKIGVQTELLSFYPLSFNSLGESLIMSLLNYRPLSEDYLNKRLLNNKLGTRLPLPSELNISEIADLGLQLKLIQTSPLWKSISKDFKIIDKDLIYTNDKNFIFNLKALAPLLVLKRGDKIPYKIKFHQKGQYVDLEANPSYLGHSSLKYKNIKFIKVKKINDGPKLVKAKQIDVFIPANEIEVSEGFYLLKDKKKFKRLSLYNKFDSNNFLAKFYCGKKRRDCKVSRGALARG